MKRIFTFTVLMMAFVMNALAWEPVIREIHYFGMYYPDSYEPVESSEINCFSSNGYTHDLDYMKFKNRNQPNTPKVTFRSWTDNNKTRFALNNPDNWEFNKTNSTSYPGPGLYNKSDNVTNVWIRNLDSGDKFILEYYRNGGAGDSPKFVQSNNGHNSGTVTGLSEGSTLLGTQEYTCTSGGDVCISMPSKVVIRSLTIIHANYQTATHRIDPITDNGNKGYRYTLTGPGVLEDKKGAVPYITMRFGHDNDMTFVRDLGNGNFGASCIVDQTDNLNLDDPNVRLSAAYKKRYINKNGQYSTNMNDVNDTPLSQDEQAAIKERAQKEANMLKGREWTVFEADNEWDDKINWNDNRTHKKDFKWGDNFNSIFPIYGTYFYFFPEVNGKFRVKFYCEGNEEHMPLWYKLRYVTDGNGNKVPEYIPAGDDDPNKDQRREHLKVSYDGGTSFVDINMGANNRDDVTIYEYTADMEKDGVYYLCANPTIVGREHPIVRLISYEFIPTFRVDPLYSVVANGATSAHDAATIKGVTIGNFTGINSSNVFNNDAKITINGDKNAPMIKFLGNVAGATISLRQNDNDIKLDFDNITYKSGENINQGGAIVVNLDCPAGKATYVLTVAYDAVDAKWEKVNGIDSRVAAGKVDVKKWDFNSKPLAIGAYGTDDGTRFNPEPSATNDAWFAKSQLFREIHKADGLTADWQKTFMNLHEGGKEPIFKSVYDMEGDNADMLKETEGLIILADANQLGIYNENPVSTSDKYNDRYIGLMNGAKLIIPKLEAGDRVVIKMGRYGSTSDDASNQYSLANLKFKNAKDAIGTDISGVYVIGGSSAPTKDDGVTPNGDQRYLHGEYHFISSGGDFEMEINDATLVKLYSIEIYKHDETILTENGILGDNRQILYTDKDTGERTINLHLHYYGLGEKGAFLSADKKTGTFKNDNSISFITTDDMNFTYTPGLTSDSKNAKFGAFKARIGVKTKDGGRTYVTDYADYMIGVGYRQTMNYPYTWDFTDLKKYAIATGELDNNGTEKGDVDDMKTWNNYGLRVSPENTDGCLFVSGSQLYAGATMFPETKGIGIYHVNNDTRRNGKMTITGDGTTESGGLQVNDNRASVDNPLLWEYLVPSVKSEQAVYVHAKKVSGATCQAKYLMNIQSLDLVGTNANYVPKGWTCKQGENIGDIHTSGTDYSLNGSRVFEGFSGYQGKALYWRQGYAAYGYQDGYQLILQPGEYVLTYTMAAWKGSPNYKVEVLEYNNLNIVKESDYIMATPNADGKSSADLSGAERNQLSFTISSTGRYIIRFSQKGDGFLEFLLLECSLTSEKKNFEYTVTDAGGDVFAMSLPKNATESDVRLCFQGYEVNKIAVSTDPKTLNVKGWTSESRARVIDPSLTSYMSGKKFRTYAVTGVDYSTKTVTLTKIEDLMPAAENDGDKNACVIVNGSSDSGIEGSSEGVFGDQFHLFVPDMHDYGTEQGATYLKSLWDGDSKMKAKLYPGSVKAVDGNYTNFAFTCMYYDLYPETGEKKPGQTEKKVGPQAFYRIAGGKTGTASSKGNQGYLPILTSKVGYPVESSTSTGGGNARFTLVIIDDDEATGIATVEQVAEDNGRFYNLSGQQLSGKPNRSGLYIVNGKKVYIKNK